MPVTISKDPDGLAVEACCFCRKATAYWTEIPERDIDQVACCQGCAARAKPEDVPTKEVWCRREDIAHKPTIGEVASGRDREYPPAPEVPWVKKTKKKGEGLMPDVILVLSKNEAEALETMAEGDMKPVTPVAKQVYNSAMRKLRVAIETTEAAEKKAAANGAKRAVRSK